jgi:serine protease inhibitor
VAEEEEAAGQRFAFVADHPFAFYLQTDDVILFVGKVSSPAY